MANQEARSPVRILLAEDDEISQNIVQAFLSGGDTQLMIVSDGRQALEAALSQKFDLMIVDQNMPHVSGDRVILHLRAGRSMNASTPAIRFTAEVDNKPLDLDAIAGTLDVTLPKPLSREVLISTIGALLAQG